MANEPAGMLIVVLPPLKLAAAEVKVPLLRTTEPVGVGVPLTATVTDKACVVVMLDADGATETEGVVLAGVVTVTVADPVALLKVEELVASGA